MLACAGILSDERPVGRDSAFPNRACAHRVNRRSLAVIQELVPW